MQSVAACYAMVMSPHCHKPTEESVRAFLESVAPAKPASAGPRRALSVGLVDCMLQGARPPDEHTVPPDDFVRKYLEDGAFALYEQGSATSLDVFATAVEMLRPQTFPRVHLFLWNGHALLLCNVGRCVAARFPGGAVRGFTREAEAAWIASHACAHDSMQAYFIAKK